MAKCYEPERKDLRRNFKNIVRKRQKTKELQRGQVTRTDKLNNRIIRLECNDPVNAMLNFFLKD